MLYCWQNTTLPPNVNIQNAISYKVLTEIELFKPLAKGGGNIIGLAQLQ
jgi:hypothetical protein